MRRAARIDANQTEIIDALRSVGAEVQPLHTVGDGCVDILVAYRNVWYVIEIKDGSKPPSRRKLTPAEQGWHDRFGVQAPVYIAETIEESLQIIGAI